MFPLDLTLLVLGITGHTLLWVDVINRVHAWAVPRWVIDTITYACLLILAAAPLLIGVDYWASGWTDMPIGLARQFTLAYLAAGVVALAAHVRARIGHRTCDRRGEAVLSNHTVAVDLDKRLGGGLAKPGIPAFYARLPGNELFRVHVHHKQLAIPRLPDRLAGLRIAHLSDLHMSGRIAQAYFEEVARMTNELEPDLIAITGDLFDRQACFEWIETTYARLTAPLGVFYVFGNHDDRVDTVEAARLLDLAGLCHVGNRWVRLTARQTPLILAGNELPWFVPAADLTDCPPEVDGERPFRLLLSHSPDQFAWAEANAIDLMLAGHNHGGQIRFPVLGALFAPSCHGTKYDMGTFQRGSTVMHVSRGTGTHAPVRFNCPPEIAVLELRGARIRSRADH